jgi:glycolate oxidase iron-sulfur subunit
MPDDASPRPTRTPQDTPARAFPLAQADLCVMCGMCLPHCPTYRRTGNEGESPRGRIALMAALARGDLPLSDALEGHLDRCLACRSCERVCPSGVPYGRLIDAARATIAARRPASPLRRAADALVSHLLARPEHLRPLGALARYAQRAGLTRLAGRPGALLPPLAPMPRWQDYYPPMGEGRGEVALFLGCVARLVDSPVLLATLRVLRRLGYGVHVPPAQACCGALPEHRGAPEEARRLAAANLAAFAGLPVDAVLVTASGCAASLVEYRSHPGGQALAGLIRDPSEWLARAPWPAGLSLRPLGLRVALHSPCTLTNVLRREDAPARLLGRLPGVELVRLPARGECCGSAGTYLLRHPATADDLRDTVLDRAVESGATVLATSNVGCALHLAAGARVRGLDLEVVHPMQLLDRSLRGIP